jgi:hypothetical protein
VIETTSFRDSYDAPVSCLNKHQSMVHLHVNKQILEACILLCQAPTQCRLASSAVFAQQRLNGLFVFKALKLVLHCVGRCHMSLFLVSRR